MYVRLIVIFLQTAEVESRARDSCPSDDDRRAPSRDITSHYGNEATLPQATPLPPHSYTHTHQTINGCSITFSAECSSDGLSQINGFLWNPCGIPAIMLFHGKSTDRIGIHDKIDENSFSSVKIKSPQSTGTEGCDDYVTSCAVI
eukprot:scaffold2346_cov280-Alexandrium_tamarense.AAC.2